MSILTAQQFYSAQLPDVKLEDVSSFLSTSSVPLIKESLFRFDFKIPCLDNAFKQAAKFYNIPIEIAEKAIWIVGHMLSVYTKGEDLRELIKKAWFSYRCEVKFLMQDY